MDSLTNYLSSQCTSWTPYAASVGCTYAKCDSNTKPTCDHQSNSSICPSDISQLASGSYLMKWQNNPSVTKYFFQKQSLLLDNSKYFSTYNLKTNNDLPQGSFMTYGGNTCFQDSVLFALFHIKSTKYLNKLYALSQTVDDQNIQNIIKQLRTVDEKIHDPKNNGTHFIVRDIIPNAVMYQSCKLDHYNNYGTQEDAGEFFQKLFGVLNINDLVTNTIKIKVANNGYVHSKTIEKRNEGVFQSLGTKNDAEFFFNDENNNGILEFQTENVRCNYVQRENECKLYKIKNISSADSILIIQIPRTDVYDESNKDNTEYNISERISNNLELYAIVCHRGVDIKSGHYTTYFKGYSINSNNWYLYNDMTNSYTYITNKFDSLKQTMGESPYLLFYV